MNIGPNNFYRPSNNSRISFGHNQGVLDAIEKIKKRTTPENIAELQAQAKTAKLTPEFVAQIEKVTPEDLKILTKKILGLIPWK